MKVKAHIEIDVELDVYSPVVPLDVQDLYTDIILDVVSISFDTGWCRVTKQEIDCEVENVQVEKGK